MALDGAFLHHIKHELEEKLLETRVEKIYQPNRDELVLNMRGREGAYKLLLCARPDTARIHITSHALENPKQPPMLCMLLRKRLQTGKLISITQDGLERVLKLEFLCTNELGDKVKLFLIMEIMGKHSNIILVDDEMKIIDALKRVDADMSSERFLLPGFLYRDAPKQDKLCILDKDSKTIIDKVKVLNMGLSKALMNTLQGISPIVSRELEHISGRGQEVGSLNNYQENRLINALDSLRETVKNITGTPNMIITEKPLDFSFLDILQYGNVAKIRKEQSFSAVLDNFYYERDMAQRIKVKSSDILKILINRNERLSRKLNNQRIEFEDTSKKEQKKICGDLINANLYQIEKGASLVKLVNYFDEDMKELEIKLDPALTASQNAQKYYKEYRKAKTAEVKLKEQIKLGQDELIYIDSLFYSLTQATTEEDLNEIRAEMRESGYLKADIKQNKKKENISKPLSFTTSTGFTVLVGKNNKQNDKLTLKDANRNDIWLHTKNIQGSHAVIVTEGIEPDEKTLYEAAVLAAIHSKAKNSQSVPVDYTKVRYVSKPSGAKLGMVIYVNQKTLYVDPQDGKELWKI